jgi:hypothetical protein
MEEQIEARVSPEVVWEAWEKAHSLHGKTSIETGQKGKSKFRYKILDVKKGESFSILWKTLFVRLIFSHAVKPSRYGSEISYRVQIKGLFAWPVRWLLGEKIRKNISLVLKAIVRELETKKR